MFNDRIEITSPGNLPGIVTEENIYEQSFPRNPSLMQGLLYLKYVKSSSEGMDRMKEEMLDLGLPEPELQNNRNAVLFTVVLKNNIEKRATKDKLNLLSELKKEITEVLNEDEQKIVYFLLKNKIGAPKDFEKEIRKTRITVVRRLRHLEKLGAIQRTQKLGPNVKYILTKFAITKLKTDSPIIQNHTGKKQAKLL